MKKILSAVAAFALAAALISCGGNSDEFDGKVDTVLTIGAPSVTAKAYPGVNYVTWSIVPSAAKYELYRSADGEANGKYIKTVNAGVAGNAYADIAGTNSLVDGVTYKYTVVAVPANSTTQNVNTPSRDVYMKANSGSASVKAYVPAAGTEISAFTDSYTKNFIKKYADEKTIAKNAKITLVNDAIGGAKLAATFPATAGFQFGVAFINKTQPDYIKASTDPDSWTDLYLENYVGNATATTLTGGTYTAYLTMKAVASGYYPVPVVYSLGDYTVAELAVNKATSGASASWSADGKKIVLSWTPAVLASTNKAAPTTNYKVYRAVAAYNGTDYTVSKGAELTPVTATISSVSMLANNTSTSGSDVSVAANGTTSGTAFYSNVYKLEDEVPSNEVAYKYYIVNTDGTEFEKVGTVAYVDANKNKYAQQTTEKPSLTVTNNVSKANDTLQNCLKIKAVKASRSGSPIVAQKLTLSYVKIDSKYTGTWERTFNEADFKKLDLANNDVTEENYIMYIDKAETGTYLFKLTAEETGYAPISVYEIAQETLGTVDASTVSITSDIGTTAATDKKAVVVDDITAANLALYDYELVTVETTNNIGYGTYITVKSTTASITLKVDTGITAADWVDSTKDYNKYGVPGTLGTDGKYTTKPYVIVSGIESASASTTTATTRVFSVKKILKADTTKNTYAFSDNNINGKVTR